jgi:two-component system, LuxR family, sensor kinase FixL
MIGKAGQRLTFSLHWAKFKKRRHHIKSQDFCHSMSWVTIIWSIIWSTCLTLAGLHLLVWWRNRRNWANLFFALTAIGMSGITFCEFWLMRVETIGEYGLVLRWAHVPFWVMFVSIVAFMWTYFRAGRPWLA